MAGRISTSDLVLAGLGGVVGGTILARMLLGFRSAPPATLPAGAPVRHAFSIPMRPDIQTAMIAPPATRPNTNGTSTIAPSAFAGFVEGPPAPASSQLRVRSTTFTKPLLRALPPMRRFATVDDLMRSCPSQDEMERIRMEFNISFSADAIAPWSCTDGGSESSLMLSVYNAFRLFYAIDFDAPMPLIGVTNMYQWLRGLGLNWYFRPSTPADLDSHAFGTDVVIDSDGWIDPANRVFYDRASGEGLWAGLAVLIHEARHTDPGGGPKSHLCGPASAPASDDPSLTYGGAWALQYWWMKWMGEHTYPTRNALTGGPPTPPNATTIDPWVRMQMSAGADSRRGPNGWFCDEHVSGVAPSVKLGGF